LKTESLLRDSTQGYSILHLIAVGVVAAVFRICNLGTFSMWLDEILIMLRAQGSLAETWRACQANAEHPPLPALVMSIINILGCNEHIQRLVPVVLGISTAVLIVVWVSAIFGRRAGVLSGLLCALSPFHIRYSQDLKGYSYLAFFVMLTYVAVLLLEKRACWQRATLLTIAVCGGMYSSISYLLIAIPILAYCVERALAGKKGGNGEVVKWAVISLGAAIAGYAPWLPTLLHAESLGPRGGVKPWSWSFVSDRLQFLTVAGREIDHFGWGGALVATIALVGLLYTARRVHGRLVIVSFLTGTLGVEILLRLKDHWSDGRYNTVGWLFLVVLIAVGLDRLMTIGRRPVLGLCLLATVIVAHLAGVSDLQRKGRPSWDRMAEVVRQVRRPGEKLYASNGHAQVTLSYYLRGADFRKKANDAEAPIPLEGDLNRLFELWDDDQSCLLVLGQPFTPEILKIAKHFPEIVRYYSTGRLYRLTPEIRSALKEWGLYPDRNHSYSSAEDWPEPAMELVPAGLRRVHRSCLGTIRACILGEPPWYSETHRLELDPETCAGLLLHGWSAFERDEKGRTYVWIDGREASVRLYLTKPGTHLLSIRIWPYSISDRNQRVRGLLNGNVLGEVMLEKGAQTVSVEVSPEKIHYGENLLTLQFRHTAEPRRQGSTAGKVRRLAAAVDWIEIVNTVKQDD
jgi:hypothetical protein